MSRIAELLHRLEGGPPVRVAALCVVLLVLVGLADHATGPEIGFSIFYVVPVSIVAWYVGRNAGLLFATLGSVAWYIADLTAGHTYSHDAIAVWNAFTRFTLFVIIAAFFAAFHTRLYEERRRARTDGMTGLLNNHAFYEAADRELERSRRYGHPLSVAYIDLDNFKQVNDRLGHGAGDDLLRRVADVLRTRTRASDLAARLGGDEFALLLAESGAEAADGAIGDLRKNLLEAMAAAGWPVTFSIGIVTFTTPPADVRTMLQAADTLMYQAKRGGKDAVTHRTQ